MEHKFLEIRDEATCIAAVAFDCQPVHASQVFAVDHTYLRRCGFHINDPGGERRGSVCLITLDTPRCQYDPHKWGGCRTMTNAHLYIRDHWDSIKNGDVVDVQVILNEAEQPAGAEIYCP